MVFRGKNVRRFRIESRGRKMGKLRHIRKITAGGKGEAVHALINYNGRSEIPRRNSVKHTSIYGVYIYALQGF
jgi:hypothetical protein